MNINWGEDLPANSAAPGDTGRISEKVEDLPEIQALCAGGWFLAPDAPVWVFLPAVWPPEARTWVPDRSTRYTIQGGELGPPWPESMYASVEGDYNETLVQAGLPCRPPNRLWLLKPPPGFDTLEAVLDRLCELADDQDVDRLCSHEFAEFIARQTSNLFD